MDDDTLHTEASGVFDCDSCAVRQAVEGLDADNREAWDLMQRLASRFLVETHALPQVLMRLTANHDGEEFGDLIARLGIIYDVQCPRRKGAE